MQRISLIDIKAMTIEPPETNMHPRLHHWFTTQEIQFLMSDGGQLSLTLHLKDGQPTLQAGPVVAQPATEGASHE